MYTLTVTIGRNVWGSDPADQSRWSTPMGAGRWDEFKDAARRAVVITHGLPDFEEAHEGVSSWDGVDEESFKFMGAYEPENFKYDRDELRLELAMLATRFHQDAIAVVFGRSELVKPLY